jgi:hypothetical protein
MPSQRKCSPSAHPTPSNAFRRRFLRRFDERDEPVTALEADMAGPWSVEPLPGEGFGLFRAGEHPSRGFGPTAVFPDRSLALLAAAILPGTGREPLLSLHGNPDPVSGRYSLQLDDGTTVGHSEHFEEALVDALNVAVGLVRSPLSLALRLEAAGSTAAARCGAILEERIPATDAETVS